MRTIRMGILFIVVALQAVMAGDYGASFLNIGVGCRGLGMGGALTSLCDDGYAFFWNPAGLGFIQQTQVMGMVGPQFGSLSDPLATFHHLGAAVVLPRGAVASVNWVRLAVDDIPIYSELQGDSYWDRFHDPSIRPTGTPLGYLSDVEDAIFLSFAVNHSWKWDMGWAFHKVTVDMPVGVTLKWFRQSLGDGSASGMGIDVGAMLRVHLGEFFDTEKLGRLGAGVKFQDLVGSKLTWDSQYQDAIPLNLRWALSYAQDLPWAQSRLILAYDRESRYRGKDHWGVELQGFEKVAIRMGMDDGHLTCGAGLRFWKVQVDYAFLDYELDALHRVSCLLRL